jgi:hypothetical protein
MDLSYQMKKILIKAYPHNPSGYSEPVNSLMAGEEERRRPHHYPSVQYQE